MKRAGKESLKIIAAISIATFSLVAAITSTIAWFLIANKVQTSNIKVVVDDPSDSVGEITFHKYFGLSTDEYYLFNPTPEAKLVIENKQIHIEADSSFTGITLDTYSADDRHHPLLMLLKLKKDAISLYAKTEHPFIAEFKPQTDNIVATHGALTHVTTTSFVGGERYLVTNDEVNGGKDGSTSRSTVYEWDAASKSWVLIWADIASKNNPLSSVIETFFFTFSFASPADGATTSHTLNGSNPNSIAVKQSDCNESNQSAFVQFSSGSYTHFNRLITFYEGTVPDGTVYLGIVIDYYTLALEYISSYFLGDAHISEGLNFTCDWLIGL